MKKNYIYKTILSIFINLFLLWPFAAFPDFDHLLSDSLVWVPIPLPSGESISHFVTVDDSMVWYLTETRKIHVWDKHSWQTVPTLPMEKIYHMFPLSRTNIWMSVYHQTEYRHYLKHYNGKVWHYYKLPIAVPIISIDFITPDDGWAAGEWGSILHFNGRKWEQVYSPTICHLYYVRMISSQNGWMAGKSRGKSILLKYNGQQWKIQSHFSDGQLQLIIPKSDSICWVVLNNNSQKELYKVVADLYHKIEIPEPLTTTANQHQLDFFEIENYLGLFDRTMVSFFILKDDQFYKLPWQVSASPSTVKGIVTFNKSFFMNPERQLYYRQKIKSEGTIEKGRTRFFTQIDVASENQYGVAVGDIDQDQCLDVYVVDHVGVNRLLPYAGAAENPFVAGSAAAAAANNAGISGSLRTKEDTPNPDTYDSGVSLADIENDGDLDLYLCSFYHSNILYENDGTGKFKDITQKAGVGGEEMAFSNMGIWGDVNLDGYLDLFVVNTLKSNKLYLNTGTGRFLDVTEKAGLLSGEGSQSPSFCDFDNDGDLDLFIGHTAGRMYLMRHNGISSKTRLPFFTDVTVECGLDTSSLASCRSGIWGDIDNDGDMDLFLARALIPDQLYLNDGIGHFTDISKSAGFTDSTNTRGTVFFDADNDGFLDLFVGQDGPDVFYYNNGRRFFENRTKEFCLTSEGKTTAVVTGDFATRYPTGGIRADGALDLYVARMEKSSVVYLNKMQNRHFLRFKVVGTRSNRDGIGTKVWLYETGHDGEQIFLRGYREIQAGGGYYSMSSTIVHFGTAENQKYDVVFQFPSGIKFVIPDLSPGQMLDVYEESGLSRFYSESRRWLIRNFKLPETHFQAGLFAIFLIISSAVYQISLRKAWGNRLSRILILFLPAMVYLIFKAVYSGEDHWLRDVLPFGFGSFIILLIGGFNLFYSRRLNREERLMELLLACRAFEHSQWLASYFNKIKLLFMNLSANQKFDDDLLRLTNESISNFYQFIYPEIQHILQLALQVFPTSQNPEKLRKGVLRLSQSLDNVKTEIKINQTLSRQRTIEEIRHAIQNVHHLLKEIGRHVDQHFSTPLIGILQKFVKDTRQQNVEMELINLTSEAEINVRIRRAELIFIIENLISNALRAMSEIAVKKMHIHIEQKEQRILIKFRDNGCGMASEIQPILFQNGFSSKTGGKGGFGLYHSKTIVEKYGGNLQLLFSDVGLGSEFILILKRVI